MKDQRGLAVLALAVLMMIPAVAFFQPTVWAQEPKGPQAGEKAVDFSVQTLAGETASLEDYENKVLLLDFFASWCHICQDTTPDFKQVRENFSTENFAILSIESDPKVPLEKVRNFKSSYGGGWPFAKAPKVADDYGVEGYPTIFIVDPDGYVALRSEGAVSPDVLSSIVNDIITATAPPEGGEPENIPEFIIKVKINPEHAGGIVETDLTVNPDGLPVFSYTVEPAEGYTFDDWSGDVPENRRSDKSISVSPAPGAELTANFSPVEEGAGKPGGGPLRALSLVSLAIGAVGGAALGALGGYLAWHRGRDE